MGTSVWRLDNLTMTVNTQTTTTMSFMVHCDFEKWSQNQHLQSTLLVGREGFTEKSTLCTLLIMLTILDDALHVPLITYPFSHILFAAYHLCKLQCEVTVCKSNVHITLVVFIAEYA